ncbi:hypothetical protein FACS189485_18020 [Spirochaetia bacterium]|nr:hypothetical protein FACS189485_18020 [Spirochaetia bacterium]
MSNTTQRFLNTALGQNNTEQARDVYSISFVIYFLISVLVIVLAETIGLWFLNAKLNIPADRRTAALAVYQFSVATTVINIIRVPYNATIIAYEKMSFFALVSIVECVLKLAVVFLLVISPVDALIFYAFLVCVVGVVVLLVYKLYCNKVFEIAHYRYCKDKKLFRQLISFSGWNMLSGVANVSNSQGTNMLINIFSGVTVNAAIGIATQVDLAVYKFVDNFQTAFKPQIIKSYAAKEYNYFITLIMQASKISFYLLLFFALPLYVNAGFVLELWLKNVPEYTVIFTKIMLVISLISSVSGPLWAAMQATGDIKRYQIIFNSFMFANLPLSFIFLWLGYSPVWVLIIRLFLDVLAGTWRVFYLRKKINFPILRFLLDVIIPIVVIVVISTLVVTYIHTLFAGKLLNLVVSCCVSTLCLGFLVYFIGLKPSERIGVNKWIKKIL